MSFNIADLLPRLLGMGTSALGALAVFIGFWIAGGILRQVVHQAAKRDPKRQDVLILLGNAGRVGILGFGLVSALGTLGIDVSALIAGLGLTGFALGFALKDMLSSAVAGLMLLLNRPFALGDRIAVTGMEGKVVKVDLRYVTLEDGEGKRFLIPNANVLSNPVTMIMPAP